MRDDLKQSRIVRISHVTGIEYRVTNPVLEEGIYRHIPTRGGTAVSIVLYEQHSMFIGDFFY